MNRNELFRILATVPDNVYNITVIGRVDTKVSCSIPDGPVPEGWRRINENPVQQQDGLQRVVWKGGDPRGNRNPNIY